MFLVYELFASSVLPQNVLVFCNIVTACSLLQCSRPLSQKKLNLQANEHNKLQTLYSDILLFINHFCVLSQFTRSTYRKSSKRILFRL
jgi:hypothetical protein